MIDFGPNSELSPLHPPPLLLPGVGRSGGLKKSAKSNKVTRASYAVGHYRMYSQFNFPVLF